MESSSSTSNPGNTPIMCNCNNRANRPPFYTATVVINDGARAHTRVLTFQVDVNGRACNFVGASPEELSAQLVQEATRTIINPPPDKSSNRNIRPHQASLNKSLKHSNTQMEVIDLSDDDEPVEKKPRAHELTRLRSPNIGVPNISAQLTSATRQNLFTTPLDNADPNFEIQNSRFNISQNNTSINPAFQYPLTAEQILVAQRFAEISQARERMVEKSKNNATTVQRVVNMNHTAERPVIRDAPMTSNVTGNLTLSENRQHATPVGMTANMKQIAKRPVIQEAPMVSNVAQNLSLSENRENEENISTPVRMVSNVKQTLGESLIRSTPMASNVAQNLSLPEIRANQENRVTAVRFVENLKQVPENPTTEDSQIPPDRKPVVDQKFHPIPFRRILNGEIEVITLDDDEEEEGEAEENGVVEDSSSNEITNSQQFLASYKYIGDEDLQFLFTFMENTPFVHKEYLMQTIKCRTFMKLRKAEMQLPNHVLGRCFDIALRKTLSVYDGDQHTKMQICIRHPSLHHGRTFIENVTYETFKGSDLLTVLNGIMKTKPKFCVDGFFRLQIDIGDIKPKKVVIGKHSLLKAIAIAQAYNSQINGDEESRNTFEQMKTYAAQRIVASYMKAMYGLNDQEANSGYDILPIIAENLPATEITIQSRNGSKIYNGGQYEKITLSEQGGKFDVILPL